MRVYSIISDRYFYDSGAVHRSFSNAKYKYLHGAKLLVMTASGLFALTAIGQGEKTPGSRCGDYLYSILFCIF